MMNQNIHSCAVVELRKKQWGTTPRRRKRRDFDAVYYMVYYFLLAFHCNYLYLALFQRYCHLLTKFKEVT